MDLFPETHHFFQMFDHDNDGKITKQELSDSLERLGFFVTDDELELMIEHIDNDGDGSLDMEEFERLYEVIITEEGDDEDDMQEAFNVFDKNGDGFITVEELRYVLNSLGLGKDRTFEDFRTMVKKVDGDGDGMVNYNEFRQMMMKGGAFAST